MKKSVDSEISRVNAIIQNKNYALAISEYKKLIENYGLDPNLLHNLGYLEVQAENDLRGFEKLILAHQIEAKNKKFLHSIISLSIKIHNYVQ